MQSYKLYKKGKSLDVMDPTLASSAVTEQVAMCIQIGLLCTQGDPHLRPTMHRVVVILSKKPSNLEEPTRPGVPGSRYRRCRRPAALSSTAGTSLGSNSSASDSSSITNNTNSVTATSTVSPRDDPRGKRPMHS